MYGRGSFIGEVSFGLCRLHLSVNASITTTYGTACTAFGEYILIYKTLGLLTGPMSGFGPLYQTNTGRYHGNDYFNHENRGGSSLVVYSNRIVTQCYVLSLIKSTRPTSIPTHSSIRASLSSKVSAIAT